MIQSFLVKILLAPFSLLYGMGVTIHGFLYKTGLRKGFNFDLPVISVGNLTIGGAGKSPHIEYLIRILQPYINVATLSRGYKRSTKGFRIVKPTDDATLVGDEPLQFIRKFPEIIVAVGENRIFSIPEIIKNAPDTDVILLDDAFQNRAVNPLINILLTEYSRPFTKDFLLPSGRLREWRSGSQRADIVIVSKCPPILEKEDKDKIEKSLDLFPRQKIFFSYYKYLQPYFLLNPVERVVMENDMQILLICAIAKTDYLLDHLTQEVESVTSLEFEDHRYFTTRDLMKLKATFDAMTTEKKIIMTTEKDAMRLELHRDFLIEHKMPIFVLPVEVEFHFNESNDFNQLIKDRLLEFKI